MKYFYAFVLTSLISAASGFSQTINLQQVIGSGLSAPIGAYFAPGNDSIIYIVQQAGRIKVANVNTGVVSGTDFLNVTSKLTSSGNEQGLLGMAFHPNYDNNGYFFINYTKSGGGATVVARYKCNAGNPMTADLASEDIVMQVTQPYSNHNGGQLAFGPDGYLYIGLGDGGSGGDPQGNGQKRTTRLGKMLRVGIEDSGYTVPPSNPFVNDTTILPEIWSLGLRNPWRYSFDMATGDMWIADVGQELWEEIDFEPANTPGLNYGWRCYEGNATYNTTGCLPVSNYTAPAYVFSSGTGSGNCSVTGGFVYRGGTYGELYGKYIFTDYCSGKFWTMEPNGSGGWITNQVTTTPQLTYQITSFGQDNKGEMYVVSREGNRIYKMTGVLCAPADIYSSSGSLNSCTGNIVLHAPFSAGNSYAWYRNDTLLSETSSVLNTTVSGTYKVVVENTFNACGDEAVAIVTVSTPTPSNISLPASVYCDYAGNINITVSPSGGVTSGAGVSGNMFNPSGLSGEQQLVYTYTNASNCISTASFQVMVNECLSMNDENSNPFVVFPNPFTDVIQIPLDGQKNITVMGVDGKIVYQSKQTANTLSLGFLSTGTYILQITHDGKLYKRVIVKSK